MPDIRNIELLDAKDLMKSVEIPQVLKYIEDEIEFWNQTDCNALNKSWLDFCFKNHKHVKVIDHDIPNQISGKDVKITLYDMKVTALNLDFHLKSLWSSTDFPDSVQRTRWQSLQCQRNIQAKGS